MFKKPVLSPNEQQIEQKKTRIEAQIENCGSRLESVRYLLDFSKPEDAMVLMERHVMDCVQLASWIYDAQGAPSEGALQEFVNNLPDGEIVGAFQKAIESMKKWGCSEKKRDRTKEAAISYKDIQELLRRLERSYKILKKNTLKTSLDLHRRRVRRFICVLLAVTLIPAVGVWGLVSMMTEKRKIDETMRQLAQLEDMAYRAKIKTGMGLAKITGNACSKCFCKKKIRLDKLPNYDLCVQRWMKAVESIHKVLSPSPPLPENLKRDVWGSPYGLDENEWEFGKDDQRQDILQSAGPDRIFDTNDDITMHVRNAFSQSK